MTASATLTKAQITPMMNRAKQSGMAENMPILYQNIMLGLPSDFARDVFLWATDRPQNDPMCYRAEKFAREADLIACTLRPILAAASKIHGENCYDPDLLRFILTRHANQEFGGNLNPAYLEGLP